MIRDQINWQSKDIQRLRGVAWIKPPLSKVQLHINTVIIVKIARFQLSPMSVDGFINILMRPQPNLPLATVSLFVRPISPLIR